MNASTCSCKKCPASKKGRLASGIERDAGSSTLKTICLVQLPAADPLNWIKAAPHLSRYQLTERSVISASML